MKAQITLHADAPGTDISNPALDQAFRVPITTDLMGGSLENLRIALLDGEKEISAVDVPFAQVTDAPDKILQEKFGVGNGASVWASIRLRGIVPGQMPQAELPVRGKSCPWK
jgi:hypothetical protein